MLSVSKKCLTCGCAIHGRADKKFCSDQCRSSFNNQHLADQNRDYVRRVDLILKKNRKILSQLKAEGKSMISSEHLKLKGFDFSYCTNYYTGKDGVRYYYCYEHGFHHGPEDEVVKLVAKEW